MVWLGSASGCFLVKAMWESIRHKRSISHVAKFIWSGSVPSQDVLFRMEADLGTDSIGYGFEEARFFFGISMLLLFYDGRALNACVYD